MFLYLATSQIDLTSIFVSYTSVSILTLIRASSACKQCKQVTQWNKVIKINLILIIRTCIKYLLRSSRQPKFPSVQYIVTGLWSEQPALWFLARIEIFLITTTFTLALALPAPCPMGSRMSFISIRWPEHGSCHWPPSKSKAWMHGILPLLPHMSSQMWCWIRHRYSVRYWKLQFIT